jgi:coenzyme F420-reducing hydrogenase beta subunit
MKAAYAGYYLNQNKLLQSASGGAASALSEQIIRHGGVVYGVEYDNDLMPMWGVARCVEELEKFKGSKYAESTRGDIFYKIAADVSEGKPVLVIGLPCDIAAIRMYLGELNRCDNLFMCELICTSVSSQKLLKEFISITENKFHKNLRNISLRYKKNGLTMPAHTGFAFTDGTYEAELSEETLFQKGFLLCKRESCYHCSFKGENSVGDLRLGDYWGMTDADSSYNASGISMIIVCSSKGSDLLSMFPEDFYLCNKDLDTAIAYSIMTYRSVNKADLSDMFVDVFAQKGLQDACRAVNETQHKNIDEFMSQINQNIDYHVDKIALWGAGNAADILYDRLRLTDWNIQYVFDSNKMKIGATFKGLIVKDLKSISDFLHGIDVVATAIPSVANGDLETILKQNGYTGIIIHLGRFRI